MSLPELLTAMGTDSVDSLPGIQRHQEDGFHVFLCYLAAAVLARQGDTDSRQTADYWRQGLIDLAGSAGQAAWTLVSTDLSNPAFMQSAIPESDRSRQKLKAWTPDELDLLVTAKDHDIKMRRADQPHVDSWVYALVTLQTMAGYSGKGQWGIARMNSGFGNRLIVEVVRSLRPGIRWSDSVARLLQMRGQLLASDYGYHDDGIVLTWTEPWDGKTRLNLSRLDPFFIELCRRVRLRSDRDGHLVADGLPSDVPRINAKELLGVLGDPWLPVDPSKGDPKALTISGQGLTPDILRRLLFQDGLTLSSLQQPERAWKGACWMTASVLVRGQGKTDGFYEQHIRIPPQAVPRIFAARESRQPLAELARAGIDAAGTMRNRVLKWAVFALIQGGPDTIKLDHDVTEAWWTRISGDFEQRWSSRYLPWLWTVAEADSEEARAQARLDWARSLQKLALESLAEAERRLPQHHGRHFRAITEARRTFYRRLYHKNHFPDLKDGETDNERRSASF
jgi:CRISPR system Cascade subunit CasA